MSLFTSISARYHTNISSLIFFTLLLLASPTSAQTPSYVRGDAEVQFKWRLGYGEYPINKHSRVNREDANRGALSWFDGYLWAKEYADWANKPIHGVELLFRGGSPYARTVRCISDLVPAAKAGKPVTFAIPIRYTLGTEERVAVSLTISGQASETVVLNLKPSKEVLVTTGQSKVSFHALSFTPGGGDVTNGPFVSVSGILHVRVYPGLLNYGGRMNFEFNSGTRHMDVASSMVIGSLWEDLSQTNIQQTSNQVSENDLEKAYQTHLKSLDQWRRNTASRSQSLLDQRATINVSCAATPQKWDRGETRVQAYSGNPVKDYQLGPPTGKVLAMAQSVTRELGRKFSIFRYQHHHLPWLESNPDLLDSTEIPYLNQWLQTASQTSENVILDLQLSPVIKEYKVVSKLGTLPLPPEGLPTFKWDDVYRGYVTTIRYAKRVCPQLRIIQMPYEIDNISNSEVNKDAHYQIFKMLYRAVNTVNKELPAGDRLKVAGLGINNPTIRWDFIEGFLKRYQADTDPEKRLDYITWHTYLFPSGYPNYAKGLKSKIQPLFTKYGLPADFPILVDELGLAETTTIEDLSDLAGAAKKEAAMACYAASIHDGYLKENGNFTPVSGGGWHFALLTYGKQNVITPYAKGMILRNRLSDGMIPSKALPQDENGFGLYSMATRDENKISILVWTASPSIFFADAKALKFPGTQLVLNDLPKPFQNERLKITVHSSSPEQEDIVRILSQDKSQTLPLTRGADRYEVDFSPEEVKILNNIPSRTIFQKPAGSSLITTLDVAENSMYLLTIEKARK